jgi:NAD(P)-dependent dehydrogenase (short-subunit alcohol dehydrogenase family)
MDLQDKRALITGATSGMGIAVALSMAEKGASVIITGRDETRGASTVEEIRAGGHDAQFIDADRRSTSAAVRLRRFALSIHSPGHSLTPSDPSATL